MTAEVRVKRVYETPGPADGYRVLVDRLWPRGMSHERATVDRWLKEVAPSARLRTWWGHDPLRLADFAARYRAELAVNPAVGELRALTAAHPVVTLVSAVRDPRVNHAVVLRDYLGEPSA